MPAWEGMDAPSSECVPLCSLSSSQVWTDLLSSSTSCSGSAGICTLS